MTHYFFVLMIIVYPFAIALAQKPSFLKDTIILEANTAIRFSPSEFLFERNLEKGSAFSITVVEDVRSSDGNIVIRRGEKTFAEVVRKDSAFLHFRLSGTISSITKSQIYLNVNSLNRQFKFTDYNSDKRIDNAVSCVAYTQKKETIVINRKCPGKELPGRRLALIIGNASYKTNPLANPINDAKDMAENLHELGFDTIYLENANIFKVLDALEAFHDSLDKKRYDVGLLYYSGHGMEIDKQMYLVPLDATINRSCYVRKQCIEVSELFEEMPAPLKIIVLDACRNNPFDNKASRPKSMIDLAPAVDRVEFNAAKPGSLLVYAASSGKTAEDMDPLQRKNSPFTAALKLCFQEKEIIFPDVFSCVQEKIKAVQSPESVSAFGRYYLRW